MKTLGTMVWTLFWLVVLGLAGWLLGLGDMIQASVAAGHLLDWVMGGICLFWLVVILQVPWDLYFEALRVDFELHRAEERGIAVSAERPVYLAKLRPKLAWLAVGAHLVSAAVVALITWLTQGQVGYWFAGFYLLSTAFRPLAAMHAYLFAKLREIGQEAKYPHHDVVEMDRRLEQQEQLLQQLREALEEEGGQRGRETQELRQRLHSLARELETTVARLTDNQDVIKGIQALVRLIGQAGGAAAAG